MILILIIAFYLDGLLSNMFIVSDYLYPLCFLLSLVLIYPSFQKSELSKYYLISLIMGLLYDIVYTNTLFINFIIFFLIAILIKNIYNLVSNNYLSLILISFLVIVIYRTLTYLILSIINYKFLSIDLLFNSFYSSIITNFIYITILYLLLPKKKPT